MRHTHGASQSAQTHTVCWDVTSWIWKLILFYLFLFYVTLDTHKSVTIGTDAVVDDAIFFNFFKINLNIFLLVTALRGVSSHKIIEFLHVIKNSSSINLCTFSWKEFSWEKIVAAAVWTVSISCDIWEHFFLFKVVIIILIYIETRG